MAAAAGDGSAAVVVVLLLLLLASLRAHALTSKEGRQGELGDQDSQENFIEDIENFMTAAIPSDDYFGPGPVTAMFTDVSAGIRMHARLLLHNTGSCLGADAVGLVTGYELVEVFFNNMLSTVVNQIRNGFGFGVVVEATGDDNLSREGLTAQFYYWTEIVGQEDVGGSTPNTQEADGPSDNNLNRHDELSLNVTRTERSFNESSTTSISLRNNMNNTLYRVQPPPKSNKTMPNNVRSKNTTQDTILDDRSHLSDCPPYYYSLFTSNYDINALGSPAYIDGGFPDLIYSPSQEYFLIMQDDCNLVLYYSPRYSTKTAIWACGDSCYQKGTNCFARINLDGTFAVYDGGSGNVLWYTPTQCSSGSGCWSDTYLTVQDDGNVVLYLTDTNEAIWATGTNVS